MSETHTDHVTMADFRQACLERLEHALAENEPGLSVHPGQTDTPYEQFETPAGLLITRYAGWLTVECDFGDEEGEESRLTRIEFVDEEEAPVEVTDTTMNHKGTFSKTIARKDQDALATELAKYITLIP